MKHVRVAELKARLSEYLQAARRGESTTVLNRDTPIARIVPIADSSALRVRKPRGQYRKLQDVPLPPPLRTKIDVVELLLEDRRAEE